MGRLSSGAKAFIARRHKLLIDGRWVDAKSGKTFAVYDPSNGQQIAQDIYPKTNRLCENPLERERW